MGKLLGNGNNGWIKPGSFTKTWYDSGNSEEGGRATFCQLAEPLKRIPTLWMLTKSISLQVIRQNISETENASSATKRDVTHPSTEDTQGKEEEEDHLETVPPGRKPQKAPKRSKPTQK